MVSRVQILAVCFFFCLGSTWALAVQETKEVENAAEAKTETPEETPAATKVAARPRVMSQDLLPASTKAWFSVPDLNTLKDAVAKTQLGAIGRDEELKPFVESFKSQFQAWLNKKNVRLGFKIEQFEKVNTGEICVAGVLQTVAEEPARNSHGLVLLVNVEGVEEEAKVLLAQVIENFKERGAEPEPMEAINGVVVQKFAIKSKIQANRVVHSFCTIDKGWLLASDNENVFREIIRRLAKLQNLDANETLAAQPGFKNVMKNTDLGDIRPHFKWFVDPFGYVKLAQTIADEERIIPQQRNDKAEILKNEGFDAFDGIGGQVAFAATGPDIVDVEILHRTFLYAPRDKKRADQQRVFALFDFENKNSLPLEPHSWIPPNVSNHICLTWDLKKAYDNVGFLVDAFMDEGTWEATIDSIRQDPNIRVDVGELVSAFGSEITVMSATEKPITEESERVVIGLPMKKDLAEAAFQSIFRALPRENASMKTFAGKYQVIVQDTTIVEDDPLGDLDEIDLGLDDEDGEDEPEDFHLFEKRYITVFNNDGSPYLLVSNNKEYLIKILTQKQETTLKETSDYNQVQEALGRFADQSKVSFRQFGRMDKALHVNYEMLRQGKMATSKTVLARVLNQVMTPEDMAASEHREQQFDASTLPENFEERVAPYFGPSGWVVETEADGWRLTGCILKKKPVGEMVRKPDSDQTR